MTSPTDTPTTTELHHYIGKTGTALVSPIGSPYGKNELSIPVMCVDTRTNAGRVSFQVAPLHGEGTAWTTKVTFDPKQD